MCHCRANAENPLFKTYITYHKIHPFKVCRLAFNLFTKLCHYHCYLCQNIFLLSRNSTSVSSRSTVPLIPRPWQPLTYFLSPWICLFWTFHVYENTVCGHLCLLLSVVFAVFICVVHVSVFHSFLFMVENYCLVWNSPRFVYPFITWWTSGLFLLLGCF